MFQQMRRVAVWVFVAAGFLGFLCAQNTTSGSETSTSQAAKIAATAQAAQASGAAESPHPIQLDAQHKPITEGGFVKSGPVVFEDISEKAGLTKWTHKMGTTAKTYLVETKGSGIGLIDYDNDGWLDIFVVNGSTFDALDGKETPPHAALFHNNHDGTFTDVAAQAGVTQ
jgi:hypothetical protein